MANSVYTTSGVAGVNFLASGPTPVHKLGMKVAGINGTQWVYVLCSSAVTGAGYACVWDTSFNNQMVTTANNGGPGAQLGVAPIAMNSGDYGWVQYQGPCNVRVAASTAGRTALNTTTTAGQLGSDHTVGSGQVQGLNLVTTQGASAGLGASTSPAPYGVISNY